MGLGSIAKFANPMGIQAGAAGSAYNKLTKGPDINVEQIDPRYKTAVREQSEAANRFRQNLPSFKEDLFSSQADPTRAGLANRIAGQRSNLSSRGLLYGGMRQGKEAGEQAALAGQLGGLRQGANLQGSEMAQGYELAAIQNAQDLRRMEQERNQLENDLRVQQTESRKGLLSNILPGVGAFAGSALGGR